MVEGVPKEKGDSVVTRRRGIDAQEKTNKVYLQTICSVSKG